MTSAQSANPAFWDKVAEKYSRDPIADMSSYEDTLRDTAKHLSPKDFVVELGCGTGTTALKLAPLVNRYLGTDLSAEMVRIARQKAQDGGTDGLEFQTGEVETDALASTGSVDAVLSYNHLHLVPDPAFTIARAAELLRPGGLLMSKTMCLGETLKFRLMKPMIGLMKLLGKGPDVVQFFTIAELEEMMRSAGLEIIETADQAYPRRFIVAKKIN